MMLTAVLDTGSQEGLTVVSTHLEDRSTRACRREQMKQVLSQVAAVPGPLVIGGDLKTHRPRMERRHP